MVRWEHARRAGRRRRRHRAGPSHRGGPAVSGWHKDDEPLEVEELRYGSWAGPGAGPLPPVGDDGWERSGPSGEEPNPWERALRWIRAHARPLAIGGGLSAVALLVIAIAASPNGSPDAAPATSATVAPSTTEARPVTSRPPRATTTTTTAGAP